ncbi:MAG: FAD-dependent oxidoreductase [Pseudolabrys sp.]|nr:FAD-dependent oxidoreductase [Pseudolabrys sp.]
MNAQSHDIIVVGQGAAGLAAALAAAQAARGIRVTLVDKASEQEAGGNTRWSPSYMRMASPDRVEPSFVHDMLTATQHQGDEAYFARLAKEAPATVKWIAAQGVTFIQPVYYLAKGPPRIQPEGGGPAVVKQLALAAKAAGVIFRYNCAAQALTSERGRVTGLVVTHDGVQETLEASAVILCSGGFEGDGAAMREHFGEGAQTMRLISPGGKFNTGDGIKMAVALGAALSGDWNGMHAEPVDARSKNSAPVVLVYPYGIVVDKHGQRFFDEGYGLVHETWEWFARGMHFKVPGSIAFAILDSRLLAIQGYERAIRSEVPPVSAGTLAELAKLIGVDADKLAATVAVYNAACTGDPNTFDATRCDGLAASHTLQPPKSNWARTIQEPPFLAYPLVGAVAYTFGGLATDASARVLRDGLAIPGLYAAGEITGHFYATAPNAVSVLRAFVFGRIAGLEAVSFLQGL